MSRLTCPGCGRYACECEPPAFHVRRDSPPIIVVWCALASVLLLVATSLLSGCTPEDRSTSARTAANVLQTVGDAGTAALLLCEITELHLAAKPVDQIDRASAEQIMAACKAANESRKAVRLTHDALLLATLEAEALEDQRLPSVAAWAEVARLTALAATQTRTAGAAIIAARKATGRR